VTDKPLIEMDETESWLSGRQMTRLHGRVRPDSANALSGNGTHPID